MFTQLSLHELTACWHSTALGENRDLSDLLRVGRKVGRHFLDEEDDEMVASTAQVFIPSPENLRNLFGSQLDIGIEGVVTSYITNLHFANLAEVTLHSFADSTRDECQQFFRLDSCDMSIRLSQEKTTKDRLITELESLRPHLDTKNLFELCVYRNSMVPSMVTLHLPFTYTTFKLQMIAPGDLHAQNRELVNRRDKNNLIRDYLHYIIPAEIGKYEQALKEVRAETKLIHTALLEYLQK